MITELNWVIDLFILCAFQLFHRIICFVDFFFSSLVLLLFTTDMMENIFLLIHISPCLLSKDSLPRSTELQCQIAVTCAHFLLWLRSTGRKTKWNKFGKWGMHGLLRNNSRPITACVKAIKEKRFRHQNTFVSIPYFNSN